MAKWHDERSRYLGGNLSQAYGINNKGQVVGYSSTTSGQSHAFLWQTGTMTDLGTLGGNFNSSKAYDINNKGQVVGYSSTTSGQPHAFLWQNGTMQDLGLYGTNDCSDAVAINYWGKVVGRSFKWGSEYSFYYPYFFNFRAIRWNNGTIESLSSFGGDSQTNGINNKGRIVGSAQTSYSAGSRYHAVLWKAGTISDLNSLLAANSGWELISAEDINNNGQIVGFGEFNGKTRAVLLTPTWVTN